MPFDLELLLKTYPGIPKDYQEMMAKFNGSGSCCGCLTLEFPTESESMFPKLIKANNYIWILTDFAGKWIGYEKDRWRIVGIEEIEQTIHYLAFDLADLGKSYNEKGVLF